MSAQLQKGSLPASQEFTLLRTPLFYLEQNLLAGEQAVEG
jgi:hypothetical protein